MTATDTDTETGFERGEGPDFGRLTLPEGGGGVEAARDRFRIAILGDFSGRASRGVLETGEDLAKRKPMKLDVDTIDEVIRRFRTQLVLPIGRGGTSVEVELGSIDDLHPDELYDSVEVFAELQNLRRMLRSGRGERALAELKGYAEKYGELEAIGRRRARGVEVPADMRLDDFSRLIGMEAEARPAPTPAEELIGRVVAPYVVKAPDPEIENMVAAVDEALSGAMRTLLHNPDFQAVESVWRSLDLLARRIETGDGLELVVYDVAAEEFAADLSAADELSETGLYEMLAEKPGMDIAQGRLSAVIALYQFEETPPHAALLGRMAKIAACMDAPFVSAVSAKFLDTKTDDVHPLVRQAWDALKALPEAEYLALAAPRFLLRQPYGKRSDPIDAFDFEEFTRREGLRGMLWTNPAVLVAVLLGASWRQGGGKVSPGSVMTLDDIPFYYVTDEYGDQVALPCTERLLTERSVEVAAQRGFMPVLSIAGRNEVRLGSFRSVAGGQLAGPWSEGGGAAAMRARHTAEVAAVAGAAASAAEADEAGLPAAEDDELDALLGGLEEQEQDAADVEEAGGEADLDALLAGLDDPGEEAGEPGDTDDLDALLADLEGGDDADDAAGGGDDDLDALLAGFSEDPGGEEDDADTDAELEALLKDL
jgi:predicted component of type VI protein secretion system